MLPKAYLEMPQSRNNLQKHRLGMKMHRELLACRHVYPTLSPHLIADPTELVLPEMSDDSYIRIKRLTWMNPLSW